jgi:drug/metabolite transporter (DMT)-like permease
MKFAFLFVLVAAAAFAFREVLTKRERRRTVRSAATWIVPVIVASLAVVALVFFNLNFNGKVI